MADPMVNIFHVYLTVDYATNHYETLGLNQLDAPTANQIRAAYKAMALWLHPDKAPSETFLHTYHRLFLKLQKARDELLKGNSTAREGAVLERKAIRKGPLSLHRRNLDFKARLRERREAANQEVRASKVKTADGPDKRKAQKADSQAKALNHRAAEKVAAQHGEKISIKQAGKAEHNFVQKQNQPKASWKQTKRSMKVQKREKKTQRKQRRAQGKWDCADGADEAVNDTLPFTAAQLTHRRNQELLRGTSKNVSLANEWERDNSTQAKETALEVWVQNQPPVRVQKEHARLERRGVYMHWASVAYDNLEWSIRVDLIEEAEDYYGIDASEFLAGHPNRFLRSDWD